jgi:hypothetical protein
MAVFSPDGARAVCAVTPHTVTLCPPAPWYDTVVHVIGSPDAAVPVLMAFVAAVLIRYGRDLTRAHWAVTVAAVLAAAVAGSYLGAHAQFWARDLIVCAFAAVFVLVPAGWVIRGWRRRRREPSRA